MLDESEPLRIAIYTRVSTDEQAQSGFSLDAQLKKLRTFVSLNENWTIAGEYVDEGYSGKNINRPKYKLMFEEINKWNTILILKMDRIHRKVKNALNMFEELEKKGKYFISFTEKIDTTTAIGRAMMTITLVFAQLESEQIGERVVIGMDQKAQDQTVDDFVGYKTPFGYRRILSRFQRKSRRSKKCFKCISMVFQLGKSGGNLISIIPVSTIYCIIRFM